MLSIERLRLQLPESLCERAAEIARMVAEELATRPVPDDLHLERLTPAPLEVHPLATSRELARAIAESVHAEIRHQVR
jgi:hypothetical protein